MKSISNLLKKPFSKPLICGLLFILFLPETAFADAGVPMIFLSYPVMAVALIPIILIESLIIFRVTKVTYKKAIYSSGIANAVSTLAGFPLSWAFLFFLEMITTGFRCGPGFDTVQNTIITVIVEAAWLCPWENNLYWLVPTAFIINLIIAFFVSVLIEKFITGLYFKKDNLNKKVIRKAVIISNTVSYALLIILSLGYLTLAIKSHP